MHGTDIMTQQTFGMVTNTETARGRRKEGRTADRLGEEE